MEVYVALNDRSKLVIEYLPYVKHLAYSLKDKIPTILEYEDLVHLGVIGLLQAIDRFDSDKGVKFKTYATSRILGNMIDEIRRFSLLPVGIVKDISRYNKAKEYLRNILCREPSNEEIATYLSVDEQYIQSIINGINYNNMICLDSIIYNEDDEQYTNMYNIIGNVNEDILEEIIQKEMIMILKKAIFMLPARSREVIIDYYYKHRSLGEISDKLGVSKQRVAQIRKEALMQIKNNLIKLKYLSKECML